MERTSVQSDNLEEIGYDPATETLEIMFRGGRIYQYFNVPLFLFEQLMEAPSHGSFFNQEIKNN